jgi:membrane fusion protein, multidrug efflux system
MPIPRLFSILQRDRFHLSKLVLFELVASMFLFGCDNNVKKTYTSVVTQVKVPTSEEKITEVKAQVLKFRKFNKELISNGKLEAIKKANLRFLADGIIAKIYIREGQTVYAGQRLAELEKSEQLLAFEQSTLQYRQAKLEYEDQILRMGYKLADTPAINARILGIAKLKSGLSSAEVSLSQSKINISRRQLTAPFGGRIANLKSRTYDASLGVEYFCALIDNDNLVVDFLILAKELSFIKSCKVIRIVPFDREDLAYTATLMSINPLIDKSGMIAIKASIRNTNGELLDGMAVRVIAQAGMPKGMVVPKKAVVERQGRKVVFTKSGNLAIWNYIQVIDENMSEFLITGDLKPGDSIIYDGNFNLAHRSLVLVIQD